MKLNYPTRDYQLNIKYNSYCKKWMKSRAENIYKHFTCIKMSSAGLIYGTQYAMGHSSIYAHLWGCTRQLLFPLFQSRNTLSLSSPTKMFFSPQIRGLAFWHGSHLYICFSLGADVTAISLLSLWAPQHSAWAKANQNVSKCLSHLTHSLVCIVFALMVQLMQFWGQAPFWT